MWTKYIETLAPLDGGWSEGRYWKLAAGVLLIGGAACQLYHRRRRRSKKLNHGEVVVITGCDSGLGYSLALHCWQEGAVVIASVLREDETPAKIELERRGIIVLQLDITDDKSVEVFGATVEEVLEKEELRLQALVNNSGVMVFGEFEWQLPAQARQQYEINCLGTMSITRRLLPAIRRHRARLINVTSHCAVEALPGLAVYSGSKAALQAWSTSLRVELEKFGVNVIMFVPGSFMRQSNLIARQKEHFDAMRNAMSAEARRLYGNYFERYAGYLSNLSRECEPCPIDNPRLYELFDGALLDDSPAAIYKCESWRYTFYHTLCRIAPTYHLRDWLIKRFVQMPTWRQEGEDVAEEHRSPAV